MEKFTFGLGVAGLGMIVVFVGLLILIGFITVLGLASRPKKPKAAPVKQAAPDVVAAPPWRKACLRKSSQPLPPPLPPFGKAPTGLWCAM